MEYSTHIWGNLPSTALPEKDIVVRVNILNIIIEKNVLRKIEDRSRMIIILTNSPSLINTLQSLPFEM